MTTHLSDSILGAVASFFSKMEERDRETFMWIWDQWLRSAAHLKQHLSETNAAKGLFTIQPLQTSLNVALVLDVTGAKYRRAIAEGVLPRTGYPDPGSNRFRWPEGHSTIDDVAVGDRLVFESGAPNNLVELTIKTILDDGVVTEDVFQAETTAEISYRVDRGAIPSGDFVGCAEVFEIAGTVKSIPLLATTIGRAGHTLVEGADFIVKDGSLGFYDRTPRQHENELSFFFAPQVIEDDELPYKVFGYPIGFRRDSSDQYVRGLQALWFALWSGPTPQNIGVGVAVLFGLPFTTPGTVERVFQREDGGWEVDVLGRSLTTYQIPAGFAPNVKDGDEVGFQSLTDASQVIDYINEPSFIELFNLEPRILKFHTFFVLIQHEVLQQAEALGAIDLQAVASFVERIKDVRTDFYLLIDLKIPDELKVSAQAPVVNAVISPHAMVGPNWSNRMRIDKFASPGLAYIYGYRDNYVFQNLAVGTVISVRDTADELTIEYDDSDGLVIPETGALVGKYVVELDCSLRMSGLLGVGVWDGSNPTVLSKAAFPDWERLSPGDVLHLPGAAVARNQEAYTITAIQDLALSFGLVFDRDPAAENGLSLEVRRFYEIKDNVTGEPTTITLKTAHLGLDGLDLENPGGFFLWRKWPGGEAMRQDYEALTDTGRYDFATFSKRRATMIGCDGLQFVDRVKITSYEVDDSVKAVYDERTEMGDPRP